MQRLLHDAAPPYRVLTPAELDESADAALDAYPNSDDPWIFAYGSLIWNPLLEFAERRPATLHGFHRRFCLWSSFGRGTPDRPGLVLGLDHGGCCTGVAYRIPRDRARAELRLLWRREMVMAAYASRWLTIRDDGFEATALAFVINRTHPNYAGKLNVDALVDVLANASGRLGSSRDYLFQTVDALASNGLSDPFLLDLRARVNAIASLAYPTAGDD